MTRLDEILPDVMLDALLDRLLADVETPAPRPGVLHWWTRRRHDSADTEHEHVSIQQSGRARLAAIAKKTDPTGGPAVVREFRAGVLRVEAVWDDCLCGGLHVEPIDPYAGIRVHAPANLRWDDTDWRGGGPM